MTTSESPRIIRFTQPPLCSYASSCWCERQLRVGEELQLHLPVALVPGERLEDRLGRKPLVHEERQRRHVEREPLRLAGPVEERLAERLQPLDRIRQSGDLDVAERPGLGEPVRRLELGGLLDLREKPLAELARGVLPVPVERRRERRVVPVRLRRLASS